jgi:hypothetical protein
MKVRMEDIRRVLDDFSGKFLRVSIAEDDKLELNLGYKYSFCYLDGSQLRDCNHNRQKKNHAILRIDSTPIETLNTLTLLCYFSHKWLTKMH